MDSFHDQGLDVIDLHQAIDRLAQCIRDRRRS